VQLGRRAFLTGAIAVSSLGRRALAAEPILDVIVLGAGLSGLKAALELEELGARVRVIEGRNRVGGRVLTLRDVPGQPEAGGNNFGGGYGRCLDMCRRFDLRLEDYVPRGRRTTTGIYLRGEYVAPDGWSGSTLNPLPAKWRKQLPFTVAESLFRETQPLKSPEDWCEPGFANHDIPVHTFLRRQGLSDEQISLVFDTNVSYGTSAHDVSLLMMYLNDIWYRQMIAIDPVQKYVVGGNYQLPEAMRAALRSEVHFNRPVVTIRQRDGVVETTCADGAVYRSRQVVCTLPLPVLRHVAFDPVLPEAHAAAVKTVQYFPMTQVHLVPRSRFWEKDGRAEAMWTDTAAGYVMVNRFAPDPAEITSFTAWCRGFNALRLDQLEPEEAKRLVIREIERVRPAAKGQLEAVAIKSWLRDPFAAGDYAIWGPGQVQAFVKAVGRSHGRVHFAGEHTALANRGMEAAMESAEHAVMASAGEL
jgi:monoamine oxidase